MSSDSRPEPSADAPAGFADNWAYLKTELNWLDRVLMLSVARHRQDRRTVNRVAQNRADRVSSHWWKGVVSLDGTPVYDDHRKTPRSTPNSPQRGGYQQQLETRIHHSREQGIMLALPSLCDRLQLSLFEKNMVLMGVAPEVNRRFAKMYRYLQGHADDDLSDLPTVELVMRLMCRNDPEWRQARDQITRDSWLIQNGLILLVQQPYDTLLTSSIKLSEPLLSFLLSEQPTLKDLDALLDSAPSTQWEAFHPEPSSLQLIDDAATVQSDAVIENSVLPIPPEKDLSVLNGSENQSSAADGVSSLIHVEQKPQFPWLELIVPEAIAKDLNHWANRVQILQQAAATYGSLPGTTALLTGIQGTGKTSAAKAIAHHLETDLCWIDLAQVSPHQTGSLMVQVQTLAPFVLMIKGARHWLSRSSPWADSAPLQQLLSHRRQSPGLTLWVETEMERIAPRWLQELDFVLTLPLPQRSDRQRLWERAIAKLPESVQSKRGINTTLLNALELTGGDIEKVVCDGAIAAAARQGKFNLDDIQNALKRGRYHRALRQLAQVRSKK